MIPVEKGIRGRCNMLDLLKVIGVILFIAFLPQLIIAAGIYIFVFMVIGGIISAIFSDSSGGSGGGSHSDDGDHWHGTGNPYV